MAAGLRAQSERRRRRRLAYTARPGDFCGGGAVEDGNFQPVKARPTGLILLGAAGAGRAGRAARAAQKRGVDGEGRGRAERELGVSPGGKFSPLRRPRRYFPAAPGGISLPCPARLDPGAPGASSPAGPAAARGPCALRGPGRPRSALGRHCGPGACAGPEACAAGPASPLTFRQCPKRGCGIIESE